MIVAKKEHLLKILIPFTIFIVSGLIFLPNLDRHFLWQDEAQTALLSKSILTNGIPFIHDGKNSFSQELGAEGSSSGIYKWHPWITFYIHAAFFQLFGQSDFVARFPDALFGMGTVLLCFWIMRSTGRNLRVALLAAVVLSLMVSFILLSRQCRYYSMSAFFSMSCVWAYFQFLQSKKKAEIILVISTILLFYVQMVYGTIFLITVIIYSVLAGKGVLKRLVRPVACIVCCVLPWIVYASENSYQSHYGSRLIDINSSIHYFGDFGNQIEKYIVSLYFLLFFLLVIAWQRKKIKWIWSERKLPTSFLLLYITLTLVLLSLTAPCSFFRYLAPILPVCAILIAEVIELSFQTYPLFGGVCVVIFLLNQPLSDYYYELTHNFKGPMEGLVGHLRQYAQPWDTVAITYGDMPIKWYTGLYVIGGCTGENLEGASKARWVIFRKHIVCDKDFAVGRYLITHVPWKQYRKIILDAPDTPYENREDPENHLYRTADSEERVVIYERIQ